MLEEIIKSRLHDLNWMFPMEGHINEVNGMAKSLHVKPMYTESESEFERVKEDCKSALMDISIENNKNVVSISED